MLVVLAFHQGDKPQAVRLAEWIQTLGSVQHHQCLVIHSKFTDASGVMEPLKASFRHVIGFAPPDTADGIAGKSLLFRRAFRQIQHSNAGTFLWLEPDAVPTAPGWLDAIESEWEHRPKGTQFVGTHVPHTAGDYMHAVGVYPQDADKYAPLLVFSEKTAFDQNAGSQTLKMFHNTALIRHLGADREIPHPMPALVHGDKTGAILDGFMEAHKEGRLDHFKVAPKQAPAPVPAGPKPVIGEMTHADPELARAMSMSASENLNAEPSLESAGRSRPPVKPPAVASPGVTLPATEPAPLVPAPGTGPHASAPPAAVTAGIPVEPPPTPMDIEAADYLDRLNGRESNADADSVDGMIDRMTRHLRLIASRDQKTEAHIKQRLRALNLVSTVQPAKKKK